jgi:hypothetical protein
MKCSLLLGTVLAIVPSFCSAVVHPKHAEYTEVLGVNRARTNDHGALNQVRNTDHLSDFRARSAPQKIGTFDLAGTINPGIILAVWVYSSTIQKAS